jgi:hypothetical protein
MTPRIEVQKLTDESFEVTVIDGDTGSGTGGATKSTHRVTLKASDYDRLSAGGIGAEELIRKSFEFLLEHESKESILRRFDLMEIARYFPSFEGDIKQRISR